MSKSWSLFGKKKVEETPTTQQAIENTAQKIADLNKRIEHLDNQAMQQTMKAKQFMKAKNKKKALECMKRKQVYEQQSTQMTNMVLNLEKQQQQLQMATISADAYNAFAQNAKAMKGAMKGIDADKVEEMRDDYEEVVDTMTEITDLLGAGDAVADDEAETALMELMEEDEADEIADDPVPAAKAKTPVMMEDDDEEVGALMDGFN